MTQFLLLAASLQRKRNVFFSFSAYLRRKLILSYIQRIYDKNLFFFTSRAFASELKCIFKQKKSLHAMHLQQKTKESLQATNLRQKLKFSLLLTHLSQTSEFSLVATYIGRKRDLFFTCYSYTLVVYFLSAANLRRNMRNFLLLTHLRQMQRICDETPIFR